MVPRTGNFQASEPEQGGLIGLEWTPYEGKWKKWKEVETSVLLYQTWMSDPDDLMSPVERNRKHEKYLVLSWISCIKEKKRKDGGQLQMPTPLKLMDPGKSFS